MIEQVGKVEIASMKRQKPKTQVARSQPVQVPSSMTKRARAAARKHAPPGAAPVAIRSRGPIHFAGPEERKAYGKALRDTVPHASHATWRAPKNRTAPVDILGAADRLRVPELVPLRYGRMLQSPFTFYRGSAGVMASDLARSPSTGIHVQACGDCHLLNFGGFATPERRILLDINDLDETLPAPWEWDIKRLVASFELAARSTNLPDGAGRDAAETCARAYRRAMRRFAEMDVLEIWYARMDDAALLKLVPEEHQSQVRARIEQASARSSSELVYPKLVDDSSGRPRLRDQPPTLFHSDEARGADFIDNVSKAFERYKQTLAEDRRFLLDRYRVEDLAMKVVGIGSVGTRCAVLLLTSIAGDPLFLQVKEANASVLEAYAGASAYPHHGQRVVMGQRLMQPATDIFLGWVTGDDGKHYYVRQLRDVKIRPLIETFDSEMLLIYAKACGWVAARAHAKAGDPWLIAGYLGKGESFDEAMGAFAVAYANQAERDYAALKAAVRAGTIKVQIED